MRLHWIILHFTGKFNTFQQETQGDKRKKEKGTDLSQEKVLLTIAENTLNTSRGYISAIICCKCENILSK